MACATPQYVSNQVKGKCGEFEAQFCLIHRSSTGDICAHTSVSNVNTAETEQQRRCTKTEERRSGEIQPLHDCRDSWCHLLDGKTWRNSTQLDAN